MSVRAVMARDSRGRFVGKRKQSAAAAALAGGDGMPDDMDVTGMMAYGGQHYMNGGVAHFVSGQPHMMDHHASMATDMLGYSVPYPVDGSLYTPPAPPAPSPANVRAYQ
ncbi:hypothetical protein EON67_02935, partial [archaeon]